ncbi:methyltransferase family protein [Mycolicibacterium fluoranthenivorans]|uniref:Protein-S-isoprenylcysteine O-methyltransferase Ste14 n=1 Tax=Mycolicibacterium fluoranthenivorans TaxID=258505 RepID=A0A7X5U4Z7_9MYCO|nr:isoprenylcysteine carboxylmethyltransferase family protein [Mycolicibacterium fluoranthenivorans]MCV7357584.1 isoprenylcysteine carboxylmethyltransferase family protein [Mycolicibacterium fluoranthenivorans]NIH98529.1 protein-S-isoprenylcysteine O-methyltransferase Ste14 [Mycolicibacterium fluoranthenivorans]
MKVLWQALVSGFFGLVFFGVLLFLPAGTLNYWQAWVFIAVFMATTLVPNVYLAVRNPATLARRMHGGPTAETRPVQKVIITATFASVVVMTVVSALDHRFGWSHVPTAVVILGNVLVVVGLVLAQAVVLQNNFAGASIRVEQEQPLVSTGLYGAVRHPMYSGALIMMFGTPLALDSYWGVLVTALAVPILVVRILDEESLLRTELAGYPAYMDAVRYRLVPYVW